MKVGFVDLSATGRWDEALSAFPASALDVYFSENYHRSFSTHPEGAAILYSYQSDGDSLVYPFFLNQIRRVGEQEISGGYHDIEGVYGFTGPVATTADPHFLAAAWAPFLAWCQERRVVAEFVRFNPFLHNEEFREASISSTVIREHVILDLQQSEEKIWEEYSSENRNMIRKAMRHNVSCVVAPVQDYFETFLELYRETMDRNKAAPSYYFPKEHYLILAQSIPSFACAAILNDHVIAISLFLQGPDRIHYYLSGCSEPGLKVAANNFLLHTAVLEARKRGFKFFHFGGGRTGAASDSLLKFKAGFARERLPVLIGRRVHDREKYEELCGLRRAQVASVPSGYFLAYRYEPAA